MTDRSNPTAADWFARARASGESAETLAERRLWQDAYGSAGFAMECALKGCVMRHLGLNRWPSRDERRDLYSHDFQYLAASAGLREVLDTAVAEGDRRGVAWMIAKDFDINRRYPDTKPFPVRLGRDMVEAVVGPDGLVEWLIASVTSTK